MRQLLSFIKSHGRHRCVYFLIATINAAVFLFPGAAWAQAYNLTQNDWSGGISANPVNAPTNLSGWNKYSSANGVAAGAGSVGLAPLQNSFTESFENAANKDAANTTVAWSTTGQLAITSPYTATNLSSAFVPVWGGICGIFSTAFNPVDGNVYIGCTDGRFARYDPTTGTATDLSSITSFGSNVKSMVYNSVDGNVYLGGGNGRFVVYRPGSGTAIDLSGIISSFWSNNTIYTMTTDPSTGNVYFGGSGTKFGVYMPGNPGTATDLSSLISGFWGGNAVEGVTFDSVNRKVYFGGSGVRFGVYTPGSPGTAADLTSSISGFWGGSDIYYMVFDPTNVIVYFGGAGGKFANYAPGSPGTATNLTSSISSFWGGTEIDSLFFDAVNLKVYLGGYSRFAVYAPGSPGVATDLYDASGLSSFGGTEWIDMMGFDPVNNRLFITSYHGTFVQINVNSAQAVSTAVDSTSQQIASATLTKHDSVGSGTIKYFLSNDGGTNYFQVTPGALFAFSTTGSDLRFKIFLSGYASVQDVTITYNYFASSGSLVSSAFDSGSDGNTINQLVWGEDATLPDGTGITVSLRTAADAASLNGAWTALSNAAAGCVKLSNTVTCAAAAFPTGMRNGVGNRWFQYKLDFASNGVSTARISSVVLTGNTAVTISTSSIAGVAVPVYGAAPTALIPATTAYTASISWLPADTSFASNTAYMATITITPNVGYTLDGVAANFFTVPGSILTANAYGSGVVSAVFPATAAVVGSGGRAAASPIVYTPSIVIRTPGAGGVYAAGATVGLEWGVLNGAFAKYNLSYSTDNGTDWQMIARGTILAGFNWTVPNASTQLGKIKVEGYDADGNLLASSVSAGNFTINGTLAAVNPPVDTSVAGAYVPSVVLANTPDINTDKDLSAIPGNEAALCVSGSLLKGSLPAVYYCGADGKRYVFVSDRAFLTWYDNFSGVKKISDADLAKISLGGNITYRPGTRMIKIQSDPRVYAVSRGGVLRWVPTEDVARRLFGESWGQAD